MKESVFRAYDIRGTVGKDFLIESVPDLATSIAFFLKVRYPNVQKIVIGHDPRIHSPEIKEQVVHILVHAGFDIFDIGLCTSPLIYFALHTESFDAGIMITASHNKKEDNGIKINVGKRAISSDEIQHIKAYFFEKKQVKKTHILGTYERYEIVDTYIAFLVKQFRHLQDSTISFVIDCGNGSAGPIVTRLKEALGWKQVTILFAAPDGTFPNHDPNPHDEKNWECVRQLLQKNSNFVLAIGLDGDADRMSVMTRSGRLLSGDQVLALFVKNMLEKQESPLVLYNVLASEILMSDLALQGARVDVVAVGNPIMRAAMQEKRATIGGETSGHFFFADRYFGFDDGIYTMLRFVEVCVQSIKDIDAAIHDFSHSFVSPEIRIFCPEEEKQRTMHHIKQYCVQFPHSCIDGIRVCFDGGWFIIRPSNTEQAISIRFEAKTEKMFKELIQYIQNVLPERMRAPFLAKCL